MSGYHEQFFPIGSASVSFQAFVIQCEPLDHVLFKTSCCPDPELSTPDRFHPIAHGYDNVQIIVFYISFYLPVTLGLNCCKICNSCFWLKLPFLKNVLDVAGNCRFIPLEQLRHLIQGKPNRFVL